MADINSEREHAQRAHDHNISNQNRMLDSTLEFSSIAIKTVVLIAGGAVVVGLGFAGSVFNSDPTVAKNLLLAVVIFAFGVVLGGASSGFTYLAQAKYTECASSTIHIWDFPYVSKTGEYDKFLKQGNFWRNISIASVIASYLCILTGTIVAWCAL